ncbi:MAG TPA: tetratricopeptide repeat protein [Steroidobacteraceae bacterium]|nr:tetratricopeptide repeat protein [Steroidobacteraceae bacterium]
MSTAPVIVADIEHLIETGLQAQRAGDHSRAAQCYERVLAVAPASFDALQLLGLIKIQTGQETDGIALLERAVALDPRQVGALNNLANALREAGRMREAVHTYARALAVEPEHVAALTNLALTLLRLGEYRFAGRCIDRAIAKEPDNPQLILALGHLMQCTRRPKEAAMAFRRALNLGLAGADTRMLLGLALQNIGQHVQAHEQFAAAEALTPTQALRGFRASAALPFCQWDRFAEDARALQSEAANLERSPTEPMRPLLFPLSAARQREYAARHAAYLMWTAQALQKGPWTPPRRPATANRLRIAYLSPDFRDHAVGHLVGGVFAGHDRRRFEVNAYCWGPPDSSGTRERIAACCDSFHAVEDLTDEVLLARLRADSIDIAIDLAGYTAHSRAALFAARVAPLQVGWLGYPGTTGGDFLDYLVADEFIIPSAHEAHFTERIVRMPHGYLTYDPNGPVATALSRADYGLPEGAVVLACLGQTRKINPLVFDPWMAVLREQPDAVLWLADTYGPATENLRREAEARGVSGERLLFAQFAPTRADYLARYRVVDLTLDTFPYGSHTTAADALSAGCPIVAVAGETFASRVSGSILRAAGLPELVTGSLEEYRALVLDLTRDAVRRERLRARLEALRATSPLFDRDRFVRALEHAYVTMWQRHERGEPPATFEVPDKKG